MTAAINSVWQARDTDLTFHFVIRHQVFVNEQGVLVMTDMDHWDEKPEVIHVLAASNHQCAGTVRLYPLDAHGRWRGDRLAVLPGYRESMIGADLVRFATVTARAQGGTFMEASIQLPNVRFFERLGWNRDGNEYPYLGIAHQPMMFDLSMAPSPTWQDRPKSIKLDNPTIAGGDALCPA